jgi:hypothetical protein
MKRWLVVTTDDQKVICASADSAEAVRDALGGIVEEETICDVCGKENVSIVANITYCEGDAIELCGNCDEAFHTWRKGRKGQKGRKPRVNNDVGIYNSRMQSWSYNAAQAKGIEDWHYRLDKAEELYLELKGKLPDYRPATELVNAYYERRKIQVPQAVKEYLQKAK